MRLFDLSLRFKMPLWGGGLILATALALSASFALQTWDYLHQEIQKNAQDLGRSIAHSLFPVMLHDEVWQAYELVSRPFATSQNAALAESLMVLDSAARVYVSSRPEVHPVLSPLATLARIFHDSCQKWHMKYLETIVILMNLTHISGVSCNDKTYPRD